MGEAIQEVTQMPDLKSRTSNPLLTIQAKFLVVLLLLATPWQTYASSVNQGATPLVELTSNVKLKCQGQEPTEACHKGLTHCVLAQNVSGIHYEFGF